VRGSAPDAVYQGLGPVSYITSILEDGTASVRLLQGREIVCCGREVVDVCKCFFNASYPVGGDSHDRMPVVVAWFCFHRPEASSVGSWVAAPEAGPFAGAPL
jgi:hypothetical protein